MRKVKLTATEMDADVIVVDLMETNTAGKGPRVFVLQPSRLKVKVTRHDWATDGSLSRVEGYLSQSFREALVQ